MAHTPIQARATGAEWMLTSVHVRDLARSWANRGDLSASVVANAGAGTVAMFIPSEKRVVVDSDVAFPGAAASEVGDLTDRMELSKHPVAGGMILHESMHARFSTAAWDAAFRNRMGGRVFQVFELLEEMRVEYWGAALHPRDSGYLRASARSIIMDGRDEYFGSPRFACQVILGRWWVGVFKQSDVSKVYDWLISNSWSPRVLERCREITLEFAKLSDRDDLDRQVALAQEMDALMPEDPPQFSSGASPGESGEGEGSGLPGDLQDLLDAIMGALSRAERGAFSEVYETAQEIRGEQDAAAAREDAAEKERNESKADSVFRNPNGSRAGIPAELKLSRKPTSAERSAAVILAEELDKARYRERNTVEFLSEIPPGRLHGAEAMRRDAALWAGASPDPYKPFKKRRRLETEEPTLTVGIMCDVSGSMGAVQPGVGSATWIISEAIYRTPEAKAAQVYFGRNVHPGLRVGERLSEVRTWNGTGAYEDFDGGFRALDGELDLLRGVGARLLFVISDGQFKEGPGVDQTIAAPKWIEACDRNGVAVVWLQLRGQNVSIVRGMEVVDVDPNDILSASRTIGQACVRTLASVSGLDSGGW